MTDNKRTVYAAAILREVPVAQLSHMIAELQKPGGLAANGNGCGNSCGNGCARSFDKFGHVELTEAEINHFRGDPAALRKELATQVRTMLDRL